MAFLVRPRNQTHWSSSGNGERFYAHSAKPVNNFLSRGTLNPRRRNSGGRRQDRRPLARPSGWSHVRKSQNQLNGDDAPDIQAPCIIPAATWSISQPSII